MQSFIVDFRNTSLLRKASDVAKKHGCLLCHLYLVESIILPFLFVHTYLPMASYLYLEKLYYLRSESLPYLKVLDFTPDQVSRLRPSRYK